MFRQTESMVDDLIEYLCKHYHCMLDTETE